MPLAGSRANWVLAGRDDELALVVGWLRSRAGRATVLSGAAGVGKTRLAAEVCAQLGAEFAVEWCAATRASASIPFGPVAQLLEEGESSGRLDDALRRAVARISARPTATLIAVDDAHLLDDASATLVYQLAHNPNAAVLITRRSGEAAPDPITALWKDDDSNYLELGPLSRDETDELLAIALGDPVETQTIDRLFDLTGGNLLFLRELVANLTNDGSLQLLRGHWRWRGPLVAASRLADLVHDRVDRLDQEAREVLRLLAFAEPLSLSMVEHVAPADPLARLDRAGLITVETATTPNVVRLAHPLYSEVLRAELSRLEELSIARRLVEAALEVGEITATRMRWVSAWALEAGVELPLNLLVDAARRALYSTDVARAEQLARAALTRSRDAEPACLLAEALFLLERHEESDAAYADASELARDDAMRARVATGWMNTLCQGLAREHEASVVFEHAMQTISDPALRDFVTGQRAFTLGRSGFLDDAAELAIPLLESPDDRVRLRALSPAAAVLVLRGQTDYILAATSNSMEAAMRLRYEIPAAPAWVASTHVTALSAAGRLDDAAGFLDAVEPLARGTVPESQTYVTLARGRVALLRGRPATAARLLRDSSSSLDDQDTGGRKAWALSLLTEALALCGDAEASARARVEAEGVNRPFTFIYHGDSHRARAWCDVAAGLVSKAREELLDIAQQYRSSAPQFELFALHDVVRLGDAPAVVDRLEELVRIVDGHFPPAFFAHARAVCDRDAAGLDRAAGMFEAFGAELFAAEAAAEATAEWRRSGRRGKETLSAARAAELRARCEGASTPALRLAADTAVVLTKREREIAQLAARGLSSGDIAEQLVLSVRTIDNHLQRIFAKLGINSRSEIAPRLAEHERRIE